MQEEQVEMYMQSDYDMIQAWYDTVCGTIMSRMVHNGRLQ